MILFGNVVNQKRLAKTSPLEGTSPIGNMFSVAGSVREGRGERAQALARRFRDAARESGFYRERGRTKGLQLWAAELGRLTGLAEPDISRLSQGDRGKYPPFETIDRLAVVLKVQARWLADGEGPREPLSAEAVEPLLTDRPSLVAAIHAKPGRWRATTILDAINRETTAALTIDPHTGEPEGGWAALLDHLERPWIPSGEPVAVTEDVTESERFIDERTGDSAIPGAIDTPSGSQTPSAPTKPTKPRRKTA